MYTRPKTEVSPARRSTTMNIVRRITISAAAAAVMTGSGLVASAASASTTPPVSTTQQRAEAIVQPSLAYILIKATGEVEVPFTDGTTEAYTDTTYASCSGSVVESDGVILTGGHCADPAEYENDLVDDVFARLQKAGMTGQVTQSEAEQGWSVAAAPSLSVTVYLTAFAASVADATGLPARILYDEPITQGDVALLQVDAGTPLPALQAAPGNPADGSDVITTGYPGTVTSVVDLANLQPTLTPGQVTSVQTYNGVQFIGISSTMSPGMSGGPTVDTQGRVVGTNSFYPSGENQQLNFTTSTAEVRRVLADNSISPKLTAADQAWRNGLNDYFTGKYREAVQEFNTVLVAIPGDRSAQQFKAKAIADYPLEHTAPAHRVQGLIAAAAAVLAGGAAAAVTLVLVRRRRQARMTAPTPTEAQLPTVPYRAGMGIND
jgi:serine protease Do